MNLIRFSGTAVALVLAVAACSGSTGSQQSQAPASEAAPAATTAATTPSSAPSDSSPATTAASSAAAGGTPTTITVQAVDSAFDVKTIKAPANSTFTVTFNNNGEIPHDIAFYDKEGGSPLSKSAVSPIISGGGTATITFTTPGPGTYFFLCLVHPKEMTGTFIVQ